MPTGGAVVVVVVGGSVVVVVVAGSPPEEGGAVVLVVVSGVVVGVSQLSGGFQHAFRTAANSSIKLSDDMGTFGGQNSTATAIACDLSAL